MTLTMTTTSRRRTFASCFHTCPFSGMRRFKLHKSKLSNVNKESSSTNWCAKDCGRTRRVKIWRIKIVSAIKRISSNFWRRFFSMQIPSKVVQCRCRAFKSWALPSKEREWITSSTSTSIKTFHQKCSTPWCRFCTRSCPVQRISTGSETNSGAKTSNTSRQSWRILRQFARSHRPNSSEVCPYLKRLSRMTNSTRNHTVRTFA